MKPWVQSPSSNTAGAVAHTSNDNTQEVEEETQKFEVILDYLAYLRPAWAIQDLPEREERLSIFVCLYLCCLHSRLDVRFCEKRKMK